MQVRKASHILVSPAANTTNTKWDSFYSAGWDGRSAIFTDGNSSSKLYRMTSLALEKEHLDA